MIKIIFERLEIRIYLKFSIRETVFERGQNGVEPPKTTNICHLVRPSFGEILLLSLLLLCVRKISSSSHLFPFFPFSRSIDTLFQDPLTPFSIPLSKLTFSPINFAYLLFFLKNFKDWG